MNTFNNGDLTGHGKMRVGVLRDLYDGFDTLADGSTVAWDCDNRKLPQAKLSSSQSFTINMTNVISGSNGVLKITTATASAITITFDTDFTNKSFGNTGAVAITTYTLPAGTGREYTIQYVCEGTTIYWYFNVVPPTLTFTTTVTGFSVDPLTTISYVHEPDKKLLQFEYVATGGTSNATTFTFVLPVAARSMMVYPCQKINNGALAAGIFATRTGLTTVDCYNGYNFDTWGAAGTKGGRFQGIIQTI